ncbi:MAG: hypothetical protein GF383_16830 [Candidatus Lokiarchaeota archaeon]|nr:hypothetical protein [Candidatus Lokiarchaeota archaeon]
MGLIENENNSKQNITNFDSNLEFVQVSLTKSIRGKNITIDLLQAFNEIMISESIYQKILTGYILIKDRGKKFDHFLINGSETLNIQFNSLLSGYKYTYKFKPTSFQKPFSENNTELDQIIRIDFEDFRYESLVKEYSTSFKDTTISDFIKNFSTNILEIPLTNDTVEQTDTKLTKSIPYLKFHYILKYLQQYAKSKSGNVGYLFYSDTLATYYRTLEFLLSQSSSGEFFETHHQEQTTNLNNFCVWELLQTSVNVKIAQLSRTMGSTNIYFDFGNKQYISTSTSLSQLNTKLGNNNIYESKKDLPSSFHYQASDENVYPDMFVLNGSLDFGIKIQIQMNGLIERRCGTIGTFNFLNHVDPDFEYNEYLSGEYLITDIEHHIFPGEYQQIITIGKNGVNVA